jgi:uncharacterized protein YsxB (DUF464 family)
VVAVVVEFFPDSCLKSLSIQGHAETEKKGNDLLCAALSVLVRTALHALTKEKRLALKGDIEKVGLLELTIFSYTDNISDWLKGITDFLMTGLFDLMLEFPQNLSISFKTSKAEE